jgi:hypothetical protein
MAIGRDSDPGQPFWLRSDWTGREPNSAPSVSSRIGNSYGLLARLRLVRVARPPPAIGKRLATNRD